MPQEYYNLEKVAEVLGVDTGEVNRLRERGELRAFRDSGDWKFKKEEIDQFAKQRQSQETLESTSLEDDDVLLSELELGGSSPSASGTVIGPDSKSPADSDIRLGESDVQLMGSDVGADSELAASDEVKVEMDAKVPGFDEQDLDLTLDEDVQLEDSQISLADPLEEGSGGSGLELSEELDDDDLVLGGAGSGSDITIGQDSGISLVDPRDSGLSLDEPMELATDDDSLALGEDDMLTLAAEGEGADSESPTELKTGDDAFLLTPLDDEDADEDSESGSQVIALDADDDADDDFGAIPTMVPHPDGAAMLGEDVAGDMGGLEPVTVGAAMSRDVPGRKSGQDPASLTPGTTVLPEAPYGTLATTGLVLCASALVLSGIMSVDLLRNMWSWNQPYPINSQIMDMILGLLGG